MNTQSELERIVRDWLEERVAEPRAAGLASVLERVRTTPQRRRRWLDRLTGRGRSTPQGPGGRDRPADRIGRRRDDLKVATTGLVGAGVLVIAFVLVAQFDRDGSWIVPAAGTGSTHAVAQDGSGDFTTIGEALAAAADGDTILVGPGEYVESLVIEKDITLAGDGAADAVVIAIPQDALTTALFEDDVPFGIRLAHSDASISNLSLAGRAGTVAVLVDGGSPTLSDLRVEGADPAFYFSGGSTATLTGSRWDGYLKVEDDAGPVIEDNTVTSAIVSIDGPGETILRGNTFLAGASTSLSANATGVVEGNDLTGGNIGVDTGSDILVQGNTVRDFSGVEAAIVVRNPGSSATVSDNTVTGSAVGISVANGSKATIEGNTLTGNRIGLVATAPDVVIEGNTARANRTGFEVSEGTLTDNTIVGNGTGLVVTGRGLVTITGNALCENGVNARRDGLPFPLDGNEVCPESASAG